MRKNERKRGAEKHRLEVRKKKMKKRRNRKEKKSEINL